MLPAAPPPPLRGRRPAVFDLGQENYLQKVKNSGIGSARDDALSGQASKKRRNFFQRGGVN
jgi:hypothetical protein